MAGYVDGFVLPLRKKDLAKFRKHAALGAKIWMDHGALDYREGVGDDLRPFGGIGFPKQLALKKGETVVFAYIRYKSRAHRDKVVARVMKDERMPQIGDPKKMPFDRRRVLCAGFELIVSGAKRRGRG